MTMVPAGGAANYYVPNAGFITMFASALVKMVMVVQTEYSNKPVRINEVCLHAHTHIHRTSHKLTHSHMQVCAFRST